MTTTPAVHDPRRRSWGHRLTVTVSVTLLGLAAAGCANPANLTASTVEGSPMAAAPIVSTQTPTAADCNKVNYPLIDIPALSEGEPAMMIPRPPGWQDMTDQERFAELAGGESAFMQLGNPALSTADRFIPNAVVVMESWKSEPGVSLSQDAQEFFAETESQLMIRAGAESWSEVATTVCGHPAEMVEYTAQTVNPEGVSATLSGKALIAIAQSEYRTYGVVLVVATTEPGNAVYQLDSQAILDGFQFLPHDSRW